MKGLAIAVGLLCSNVLHAEIREIRQLSEVAEILPTTLSSNDWVLFDIDYTLTAPDHPALQMNFLKQNKQLFRQELARFTEEEQDLLPMLMVTQVVNKLTEPTVPALLHQLQIRGATVLGFTSADTSVFPDVGYIPSWRSQELKRLNIAFTEFHIPYERLELTKFPPFRSAYPLYSGGILYANNIPTKGDVLATFIDMLEHKPTTIVLVDDTLDKLQSVQEQMDKKKIPFLGLHYLPTTPSVQPVSEDSWHEIWEAIHKRVKAVTTPESTLQRDIKLNEENAMSDYTITCQPEILLMGIECRTSNAPDAGPQDIPKHWAKFYGDNILNQIPNKDSDEVIALYCDYESDYTAPYSFVIGCPVTSIDDIPEGMVVKTIPAASYAVFYAIGEYPKSLIDTWGAIWHTPLDRTYTGDFEVYGDKFVSGFPQEVQICIAIENKAEKSL